MINTRYTFRRHIISRKGFYKCPCGHRYSRSRSTEWTENPFHVWQGREAELTAKCKLEADEMLVAMQCPKCEAVNNPQRYA